MKKDAALPVRLFFELSISFIPFFLTFSAVFPVCALAQLPEDFQRVELLTELKNSVNFEFAPDGRIFILDRYGEIIMYNPATQLTVSAGKLDVFHDMEDGLLSIAFDPQFERNGYVYIHYSPLAVSKNRVSRFLLKGDKLDLSSEVVILEWATDRNGYYHAAGDMDFDSKGNLYIATGDNTNHSKYATLDESDSNLSSERTSSNTDDLRGKILRIKPESDGTYSIPEGNLFPEGTGGQAEIYVMGARNPFKIFVDKKNSDWLFWAEVGPDANKESNLGPVGMDEINLTKKAGNYGWPYFSGENEPYLNTYTDPNFFYDPNNPVNLSKWNTGAKYLPPAVPSWLAFFHECYLAGPRYYFDPSIVNPAKLPIEFDEAFFYYDFNSSKVWVAKMDDNGNILSNKEWTADVVNGAGFIDLKISNDGQLYILEYGAGCCPENTGTGKLVRYDFIGEGGNRSPEVSLSSDVNSGSIPLKVHFSSEGTIDPDGDMLQFSWDFEGNGSVDSNEKNPSFVFTEAGVYQTQVQVKDGKGGVNSKSVKIYAGNNAATFEFLYPPKGGMISWGDSVDFQIVVNDMEDGTTSNGTIDCESLSLVPSFGHLNHFHDGLSVNKCEGALFLDATGHDTQGQDDIFVVLNVNYEDEDGLTSFDQMKLYPKVMEAEFYDLESYTHLIDNTDPLGGGRHVLRALSHNAYLMLEGRDLENIDSVSYRLASISGGSIEVRSGSPDGILISTVQVMATASLESWTTISSPIENPGGQHDLYFVFKSKPGDVNLFDLNYIEFKGSGVSKDGTPPELIALQVKNQNSISLKFNEALDKNSAEQLSTYSITNEITVTSTSLQADRKTVLLTTSAIPSLVVYELTVKNLTNESGVMADLPFKYNFMFDNTFLRINSGGPALQLEGIGFEETQFNIGGSVFVNNSVEIESTTADELYQTEIYGDFTYSIPVPQKGYYSIALHFAELFHGVKNSNGLGARMFNVVVENGQAGLNNYDIIREAGAPATAIVEMFNNIYVEDGYLTLTFTSVQDKAKVSAIEVSYGQEPEPSLAILNPLVGATVTQPFKVFFRLKNSELQEDGAHIHKIVDGVDKGELFTQEPVLFSELSEGTHAIELLLVNADHTPTTYSDQIQVKVAGQIECADNPFPTEWKEQVIGQEVPYRSPYIFAADLDGDGLKDVVTGGWWYKNPGSPEGNWSRSIIGAPMNNMALIYDFDRDGDLDIFGTQGKYVSAEMAWAENDGKGNFTVHTNIPAGTSTFYETFMAGAAPGNFNEVDNTQIAVVWNGAESSNSSVQMLTVPADPVNERWTIESASPDSYGEDISAGDIDKDGDLDLFQGGNWLRNDNGSWTTFSTGISLPSHFDRNALADLDKDGILDGIVNQIGNGRDISWFVPSADPTKAWSKKVIGSGVDGGLSLDLADIDFDGDLDVLTGEWKGKHRLLAFENDLCNTGTWIMHELSPGGPMDHHDGAQAVDIDNDGDLDILSIGWDTRIPRIYVNNGSIRENIPPVVVNPVPNQRIKEGTTIDFTFAENTFQDADGDELTFKATLADGGALPSWLTFNAGTRTFNGTPEASAVGSLDILLIATDTKRAVASDVFILTVESAAMISAPFRMNAGGASQTSSDGASFLADQYFSGISEVKEQVAEIANTTEDVLYHSQRAGKSFTYNLPFSPGAYQLLLHFADLDWTGAGKRIFTVTVEGNPVLTDYDIIADGGAATAVIKESEVTVEDGMLTIEFSSSVDRATVSAIEIVASMPTAITDLPTRTDSDILKVYPNPFDEILHIKIVNDYLGPLNLVLYDFTGRRIAETSFEKELKEIVQQLPLSYSRLPAGVYLLRVSSRDLKDQILKIIKE